MLEDELARARKDIDYEQGKSHDREKNADKLHPENRELASQLAAQTQTSLNVSEKLDAVRESLRAAESATWVGLSRYCRRIRGSSCLLSLTTEIS